MSYFSNVQSKNFTDDVTNSKIILQLSNTLTYYSLKDDAKVLEEIYYYLSQMNSIQFYQDSKDLTILDHLYRFRYRYSRKPFVYVDFFNSLLVQELIDASINDATWIKYLSACYLRILYICDVPNNKREFDKLMDHYKSGNFQVIIPLYILNKDQYLDQIMPTELLDIDNTKTMIHVLHEMAIWNALLPAINDQVVESPLIKIRPVIDKLNNLNLIDLLAVLIITTNYSENSIDIEWLDKMLTKLSVFEIYFIIKLILTYDPQWMHLQHLVEYLILHKMKITPNLFKKIVNLAPLNDKLIKIVYIINKKPELLSQQPPSQQPLSIPPMRLLWQQYYGWPYSERYFHPQVKSLMSNKKFIPNNRLDDVPLKLYNLGSLVKRMRIDKNALNPEALLYLATVFNLHPNPNLLDQVYAQVCNPNLTIKESDLL